MGGPLWCVLVIFGIPLATSMPPMEGDGGVPLSVNIPHPRQDLPSEDFSGGFSKDFAQDLPTREFMGDFLSRNKRQAGVSSAIDDILNTPYKQELVTNHLQALLTRNSFNRPARASTGSSESVPSPPQSRRPGFSANQQPFIQPSVSNQRTRSQQGSPSFVPPGNTSRKRTQTSFVPLRNRPQPRPEFRQEATSEEGFSSTSFTGQQFRTPFPTFGGTFFESTRSRRQKREVTEKQDVTSQISSLLSSPYQGSIPSSITSLFSRNNRVPRKSKPTSEQLIKNDDAQTQEKRPSENPFEIPFRIPNFFKNLGIRRRSLAVAEERQGISDAIDGILFSPYRGSRPSSIQSLLGNNRNRFVRKTQPNPQPGPNAAPFANPNPFPSPSASPQPFARPHPVASNDPSQAAVRLFPSKSITPTGFSVNIPSGHISFRSSGGRNKRSADTYQNKLARRLQRFLPYRQQLRQSGRAQGNAFPASPNRYRVNLYRNENPKQIRDPEFDNEHDFNDVYEDIVNGSPEFHGIEGIKPLNFLTNFNSPFEGEIENESSLEQLEATDDLDDEPSLKPNHPQRRLPRYRFSRPVRQLLVTPPGLRPGPSPPAHILPPTSSVRAPRHIIMENRRLPKSTRQQDIPVIRRTLEVAESKQSQVVVPSDVAAAKQESNGFMENILNGFPSFASVGGFSPMSAADEGDASASFVPDFRIPVVDIPDIPDNQPQFNLPQFTRQKQGSLTLYREDLGNQKLKSNRRVSRKRRTAGEPDPLEDPSAVPHKRVHRVQSESQIPHSRNPREFQGTLDNQAAFSEIPFHIEPLPAFEFPVFQSERIGSIRRQGREFTQALPRQGGANSRHAEDDFIVPQGQRFYPTFGPRLPPPSLPPPRRPFFPSAPSSPTATGNRFNGHGPGFRESPSIRDNRGFRDFHDTFYGPGGHEAISRPEFTYPSSRRPVHREEEYLDNTLLGSGNFEILRGGTFYDDDDEHAYDHLLHEGYYGSHASHNIPHSNNHVDDFFSNFRDFSEFAARRSDDGEPTLDDGSYFGQGFASEHIPNVINSSHPDFPSILDGKHTKEDNTQEDKRKEEKTKEQAESDDAKENKDRILDKSKPKGYLKHKQPKNIQEVLADLEAQPSEYAIKPWTVDEKDPLIAMF